MARVSAAFKVFGYSATVSSNRTTFLRRIGVATVIGIAFGLLHATASARNGQGGGAAFKVTLLGTGTPTPSAERFGACILVEAGTRKLLFDAGRGCVIRLEQVHIPWRELTDVFLTHLHADHTFALPDVFLMGWILGRTASFDVHGPAGTREMFTAMVHALDVDIASRVVNGREPPKQSVTEIAPGVVYQRDGIKVTAFDVDHTVKPAFGYRIDFNGRSAVLSGDTKYSENLIRNAHGVDVLVHEVVFGSPGLTPQQQFVMNNGHTVPEKAAQVFNTVKPRLALYTHVLLLGSASDDDVMSATRKLYPGRVEMGTDLTEINIGSGIDVRHLK